MCEGILTPHADSVQNIGGCKWSWPLVLNPDSRTGKRLLCTPQLRTIRERARSFVG